MVSTVTDQTSTKCQDGEQLMFSNAKHIVPEA